jgi:hypothetical protein
MIERADIERVKKIVVQKFPEFKGIEPEVTEKEIKPQNDLYNKLSLGIPKHVRRISRLKFMTKAETVDRISIDRILVVTLDENGEIIKITESR